MNKARADENPMPAGRPLTRTCRPAFLPAAKHRGGYRRLAGAAGGRAASAAAAELLALAAAGGMRVLRRGGHVALRRPAHNRSGS